MDVCQSLRELPEGARGSVLVIGNLDGVHLGHRGLIDKARGIAEASGRPLAVMTFEPHPREFFQKEMEPFRLTLLPMKQRLLSQMGVDFIFAPAFDSSFAAISVESFIHDILASRLGISHAVVGADFAFGRGRAGTAESLAAARAFPVTIVPQICCGSGEAYSSTRIRQHLRSAEFEAAANLLGWKWSFMAEVVHGDKRGRTIGYPTANQNPSRYVRLPFGVYAVRARMGEAFPWMNGVANFGIRPMFETRAPLFETYLFDFSEDIYGRVLEVQPVMHLRPEMKFSGLDTLKDRIGQDCLQARAVLESTGNTLKNNEKVS